MISSETTGPDTADFDTITLLNFCSPSTRDIVTTPRAIKYVYLRVGRLFFSIYEVPGDLISGYQSAIFGSRYLDNHLEVGLLLR